MTLGKNIANTAYLQLCYVRSLVTNNKNKYELFSRIRR